MCEYEGLYELFVYVVLDPWKVEYVFKYFKTYLEVYLNAGVLLSLAT